MFKKIFWRYGEAIIAAVFLAVLIPVSCAMDHMEEELSETGIFVMDTYCEITLSGGDTDSVSDLLYELEDCFDRFDEKSGISVMNSGGTVSENTYTGKFLRDTLALQEKYKGGVDITSGALTRLWNITGDDPHVPSEEEIKAALETVGTEHIHLTQEGYVLDDGTEIDTGAAAKGYALDCVKVLLDEDEVSYGVVSMTSSMLLYGEKPEGEPFRIAVRGAEDGEILGTVETESCFLSTSGGYERFFTDESGKTYSHILDTKTGYPVETDLATVTVFCGSGLLSDYLSTLIYMDGTASIEKHLNADEYKLVAADMDGNIYVSDGLVFIDD